MLSLAVDKIRLLIFDRSKIGIKNRALAARTKQIYSLIVPWLACSRKLQIDWYDIEAGEAIASSETPPASTYPNPIRIDP
jgi:hypothetical protein